MAVAGSPGIIAMMRKTMIVNPKSTGIAAAGAWRCRSTQALIPVAG